MPGSFRRPCPTARRRRRSARRPGRGPTAIEGVGWSGPCPEPVIFRTTSEGHPQGDTLVKALLLQPVRARHRHRSWPRGRERRPAPGDGRPHPGRRPADWRAGGQGRASTVIGARGSLSVDRLHRAVRAHANRFGRIAFGPVWWYNGRDTGNATCDRSPLRVLGASSTQGAMRGQHGAWLATPHPRARGATFPAPGRRS